MAKEGGVVKYDPNTEAFQMRAQWKKTDNCRMQWHERWSWLLDERKRALAESNKIRAAVAGTLPHHVSALDPSRTLKPVPVTSTGFIGWLAQKPECQLEIYTSWLNHIPIRLPDTWDSKDYLGTAQAKTE